MILDVAFKRAVDVYKKQCLEVGLTCTILDVTFQRVVVVCMKQYLWVRLTCIILGVAFQRVAAVGMHYCIFIIDGGFEPACVTLICIAS